MPKQEPPEGEEGLRFGQKRGILDGISFHRRVLWQGNMIISKPRMGVLTRSSSASLTRQAEGAFARLFFLSIKVSPYGVPVIYKKQTPAGRSPCGRISSPRK
jgi:hypothetical protein